MPQLMPLMWINSIMVVLLILLMLINMYYYSEELELDMIGVENMVSNMFKW